MFTDLGQPGATLNMDSQDKPGRQLPQYDIQENQDEDEGIIITREEENLRFNVEPDAASRQETEDDPEQDDGEEVIEISQHGERLMFADVRDPNAERNLSEIAREVYRGSTASLDDEHIEFNRQMGGPQAIHLQDQNGYILQGESSQGQLSHRPLFGQGPMYSNPNLQEVEPQVRQGNQYENELDEEINRRSEEPEAYQ